MSRSGSSSNSSRSTWVFYTLQDTAGDAALHPNAFRVRGVAGPQLTLADVQAAFPLRNSGAFHFRWKVTDGTQRGYVFLDVVHPTDSVPLFEGKAIAKVLRLDALTCMTRTPRIALQPRATAATAAATSSRQAPAVPERGPARSTSAAKTVTPTPRASQTRPGASSRSAAAAAAAAAAPPLPSAATGRRSPATPAPQAAQARPRQIVEVKVEEPEEKLRYTDIPEDLRGKSVHVINAIMDRRAADAAKSRAAVQEVGDRQRAFDNEQDQMQALKAVLAPRLNAWAQTDNGTPRDIRALLGTLHNVLWPGANWTPVTLTTLLSPAQVKKAYYKASRVSHPDKNSSAPMEQRYIAQRVFNAINDAYNKMK